MFVSVFASPWNSRCFSRMASSSIHLQCIGKNTAAMLKKLPDPFAWCLPQPPLKCNNTGKVRVVFLPDSIPIEENWNTGKKAETACFKRSPVTAFED